MKKSGFTLIEIIAVIVIIGILSIIILPNVVNLFGDAKKDIFINESREIYKSAVNSFVYDTATSNNYFVYGNKIVNTGSAQVKKLDLEGTDNMTYIVQFDKEGRVVYFYTNDGNYKLELGNINADDNSISLNDIKAEASSEISESDGSGESVEIDIDIDKPSSDPSSSGSDNNECSPGKYLDDSNICVDCPIGYYCTGGTNKTACPAGSKGTGTGKTTQENGCSLCPAGTYSDGLGNTSCSSCDAGSYTLTSGHVSCTTCEDGYYCTGGTNHTACAAGTEGTGTGKTTQENGCSLCSIGSYTDTMGKAACSTCTTGSYNTGLGNTSCTPCPESSSNIIINMQCETSGTDTPIITPIDPDLSGTVDYEVISSGSDSKFNRKGYQSKLVLSTPSHIVITIANGPTEGIFKNAKVSLTAKDDNTVQITVKFTIEQSNEISYPFIRFQINNSKNQSFIVKNEKGEIYNATNFSDPTS